MQQVFQRAKGCGRACRREDLYGRGEVGPIGGNQRFTAIGQDQDEKELTLPMHRPENVEGPAFERVASTENSDLLWEVLMMGSMSWVPSIVSITTA